MRTNSSKNTGLERAIEVVVLWGQECVLHVDHLAPSRAFGVGDGGNYGIGTETLGTALWPVVHRDAGESWVVVPEGASIELARAGVPLSPEDAEAQAPLRASRKMARARELQLTPDLWVRVIHRGFTMFVRALLLHAGAQREAGAAGPRDRAVHDLAERRGADLARKRQRRGRRAGRHVHRGRGPDASTSQRPKGAS